MSVIIIYVQRLFKKLCKYIFYGKNIKFTINFSVLINFRGKQNFLSIVIFRISPNFFQRILTNEYNKF